MKKLNISFLFLTLLSYNTFASDPIINEVNLLNNGFKDAKIVTVEPIKDPVARKLAFEKASDTFNRKEEVIPLIEKAVSNGTWDAIENFSSSYWVSVLPEKNKEGLCIFSADPGVEKRPAIKSADMQKRVHELKSLYLCIISSSGKTTEALVNAMIKDYDKTDRAQELALMTFAASIILADGKEKAQKEFESKEFISSLKSLNAKDSDVKIALDSAKKIIWQAGWGDKGKNKIIESVNKKLMQDLSVIISN